MALERQDRTLGQSLVEFALIVPVFLLLCMGALDLGRVYFAHVALVGAVEQGVRTAAFTPLATPAQVVAAVVAEPQTTLVLQPANVSVTYYRGSVGTPCDGPKSGCTVTVTATTPFTLVTPLMATVAGSDTITLSARASMVVQ